MFEKRETLAIILTILVMSIIISFSSINKGISFQDLPVAILISIIILAVSIFTKRLTAYKIDTKINFKLWSWERYGFSTGSHLKKPIPIGILLSLLLLIISLGRIKFLAFLEFETKALISKVSKQYGRKRFSTVTEWDGALIAFYGMLAVLALAIISRMLPQTIFPFYELAKYSASYALFNLIPLPNLDGAKIFFSSRPLYIFSVIIAIITTALILL